MKSKSSLSLEELADSIEEKGKEWAKAKQVADRYDELKKITLAELQNNIELKELHGSASDPKAKTPSETKLERLARASDEFKDHIEKSVAAKRLATELYMEYEALKNLFDAKRSTLALERAKIGLM